ncbi:MAG: sigma-70 family RNA polymerase sigma factor [Planctomycetota bacterium]
MNQDEPSAEQRSQLTPHLDQTFSSLSGSAFAGDRGARLELLDCCRDYLLFVANQELDARLQVKCAPSDLVQNTLAKAVERFDGFEGNEKALLAWLRRILSNEIIDLRRALHTDKRDIRRESVDPNRPASRLGVVDPDQTPGSQAALMEDIGRLKSALRQLSHDHEEVIRMRNWERLSFAEIGQRMGRSEDAAKKLWGRALAKLRDVLADG